MADELKFPGRWNLGFGRFSGVYLWAGFIIVFGIWTPRLFLSLATFHSVASGQAIPGILSLAVLVPLVTGTFDLAAGATANMTSILTVVLLVHHLNTWLAIAAGIGAGLMVGAINGFVVVKLRVGSFIATLGMATVLSAVQAIASNNQQPNSPANELWSNLTGDKLLGFQDVVIYLAVIAVLVWWLLEHTPAGRSMYAIGGNEEAARLSGVRTGYWIWLSLIISGGISGLAGILYGSLNGPDLSFGPGLLLPAFAAAFLGATQVRPGRFNVWGTMIAIYALATGVEGLGFVTGVPWLADMFDGVALMAAVAFAGWRQRNGSSQRTHSRPSSTPRQAEDVLTDQVGG